MPPHQPCNTQCTQYSHTRFEVASDSGVDIVHCEEREVCGSLHDGRLRRQSLTSSRKRVDGASKIQRPFKGIALYGLAAGNAILIGNYHPNSNQTCRILPGNEQQRRNLFGLCKDHSSAFLRYLLNTVNKTQLSPADRTDRHGIFSCIASGIYTTFEILRIPQTLSDPPPQLFLIACIIFVFPMTALWRSQARNKYRAQILGVGIIIGLLVTVRAGNIINDGKEILAWSAIVALAVSSFLHIMTKSWKEAESAFCREREGGDKLLTGGKPTPSTASEKGRVLDCTEP